MSLQDFIAESHSDMDRFRDYWLKQQGPDFPLDLPPGDWFDQLMMFLSSEQS